jgi:hypothetical protein
LDPITLLSVLKFQVFPPCCCGGKCVCHCIQGLWVQTWPRAVNF